MRRFELSDEQFALVEPVLPPHKATGRPRADDRNVLNGLLWKLSTGAPWRDIPERYGHWQTVYERFTNWRQDGTWERIVTTLRMKLDAKGQIEWSQFNVDSTSIRASRAAGGARKKGGHQTNRKTMP